MNVGLLFISLLVCSAAAAQRSAVVEYRMYNNTDLPNALYATLFVEGSCTIYQPKHSTKVFTDKEKGGVLPKPNQNTDSQYIKIDHAKEETLFFEMMGNNMFLVRDNYIVPRWNISDEGKDIAGFSCSKATTTFRGREWIAWFAPEIPLPYGPWKLHGLPGLIMEMQDNSSTYVISVQKIEFVPSDIFNKDFKTLAGTKNELPLTYEQFLENAKEFDLNRDAEMKQKYPDFHSVEVPRAGYELKFEWEE